MYEYFEIDTNNIIPPVESNSLLESRSNFSNSFTKNFENELSIAVISYNRIDKTKVCVENLISHTKIPYNLILIDSGSEPDILEYYKSVDYPNKTIIRITKNISGNFSFKVAMENLKTKYCAIVSNDVIVTENAIENLLKCIKSANNIGWVSPVSSNVSNLQQVNLEFNTLEEMHEKAAEYNVSNPLKWHERMCLMPAIFFYRKECIDVVGGFDYGYFHDFADDDMSRRINRAGYKTILCKDTWVHHNHIYNLTHEDSIKQAKSLSLGRKNFLEKYYGIDAWDDMRNFEPELISNVKNPEKLGFKPQILGIGTRCGTPILEIRNKLREYGITETFCHAFTTNAKYFLDLQTICNTVNCDKIDFLCDYYNNETLDYILVGEPINNYSNPYLLVKHLFNLLKPNGTLLIKLRNTSNENTLQYSLGNFNILNSNQSSLCITAENINTYLIEIGAVVTQITSLQQPTDSHTTELLKKTINTADVDISNTALARILTKYYLFCITKTS
ncbi:MAG: glycosyltransferase family 2 protein [Lachnospiraceae bacterium]|nr:glycosyltransferase family 2 protein [Lachnospiraceae bacterium]